MKCSQNKEVSWRTSFIYAKKCIVYSVLENKASLPCVVEIFSDNKGTNSSIMGTAVPKTNKAIYLT